MKVNTRKVTVLAIILIPVICSAILSINLNAIAAAPDNFNDYVGGTIIPATNLLGPWVAIIAALALIVVAVYRKGKNLPVI